MPKRTIPTPDQAANIIEDTDEASPVGAATSHLWRIAYDVLIDGIKNPTGNDHEMAGEMARQIAAMGVLEGLFRQRNGGTRQPSRGRRYGERPPGIPLSKAELKDLGATSGDYDPETGVQRTVESGRVVIRHRR